MGYNIRHKTISTKKLRQYETETINDACSTDDADGHQRNGAE